MDRRVFLASGLAGGLTLAASPLLAMAEGKKGSEPPIDAWKGGSILVTGGTSGLGKAVVLEACRRGANVAFCGRNEKKGEKVAAEASKLGGQALFVKADVRHEKEVKAFVAAAAKKFNGIEFAINGAAIEFESDSFAADPVAKHLDVINTNLIGVLLCMRYQLEHMVANKKGAIVNIASTASIRGNAYLSSYSASKHGVVGLTRSLAKRYAKDNIRINAISPYLLDHLMGSEADRVEAGSEYEKEYSKRIPTGKLVPVEEVVRNIFWLGGEGAPSSLVGHNIILDGGTFA